ncbi:Tetratricopeptide repeat-containing protein [Desulfuromusa kysingii]|uniref:Tetratricopeptide repeat-containing protein n=1 Tax=Desulfuromusa kysingii TaxID=37625 RepID=A0A1H4CYC3_9BACT|nr:tetratricopeptide repeat protein [Desulfuromusa kysingii]SEA65298.1 Tetratricopeptide repeat-containing protein [Desulfuromusa kysingii]
MTDQNKQSLLLGKIAAYTEILVKDSNSTIFVSLAETYRKMGMFDDARQIIAKGLTLHPEFSPAYIVLARTLCQLEDYSGSVQAFEQALDLDAESLAALVGYARVRILLGEEDAARELLLRARNLTPADPIINKLLLSLPDVTVTDEEDNVDAVESQDDSVSDSSTLVSSTLADLYLAQGLTEKALDLYQRLSVRHPDDLSVRRKIKELEKKIEEDRSFLAIQEDVQPLAPSSAIDTPEVHDGAEEQVAEPEIKEDVLQQAIKTFDQWLANIERRRGHV